MAWGGRDPEADVYAGILEDAERRWNALCAGPDGDAENDEEEVPDGDVPDVAEGRRGAAQEGGGVGA